MSFSYEDIIDGFNRKDPFERVLWAKSLIDQKKLNKEQKEVLLDQLVNDKFTKARVAAAEAINSHCEEEFVNVLEKLLLEEPEFEVRLLIIDCLKKLRKMSSLSTYIEALMIEKHALVRKSILEFLEEMGVFDKDASILEDFIKKETDVLVAEKLIEIFDKTEKLPNKKVLKRMAQLFDFYGDTPERIVKKLFELSERTE